MTQLLQMLYKDDSIDEDVMNNLDQLMNFNVQINEQELQELDDMMN
jgi:hypothetical protein